MGKDFGFIRVAAAVPSVRLCDTRANADSVIAMAREAARDGVSVVTFPELCITGYTCGDLFGRTALIEAAEQAVGKVADTLKDEGITVIVGSPVMHRSALYNCAVVIRDGDICGLVPKTWLPGYNEFYEPRWFRSGAGVDDLITFAGRRTRISPNQIFTLGRWSFCCEICEDLWTPIPPSSWHSLQGALLTFNLSASNEVIGKQVYRKELVSQQSARTISGYIYCSAGNGESTQDLVFAGSSMIYENGTPLASARRFLPEPTMIEADIDCEKLSSLRSRTNTYGGMTPDGVSAAAYSRLYHTVPAGVPADTDFGARLLRRVDPCPFVPGGEETDKRCKEIISTQVAGLASRLAHIGCRTAVIGISGGLDSTLALLVAVLAADRLGWSRDRIIGVTMPGFGTTVRTRTNAGDLMDALGVTSREIPIAEACEIHFRDIGHDSSVRDVTYENTQARERTQILMDLANKTGGIVVGTGDLSELALGWATYSGDHISMYGVNSSIPKTLVRHLVRWAARTHFCGDSMTGGRTAGEILDDIIDTPISPELLPADDNGRILQVTEDLVGPYELHDFFLYNFFRFGYSAEKILFLAEKAFSGRTDGENYDSQTIRKWLKTFMKRFFSQQFKRSCLPDGPKVGSVTLSPRGDWRMPSDAKSDIFLDGLD